MTETLDLKRDELLQHRLLVAGADCAAVCNMLTDLITNSPPAGSKQEEHLRSIESSLDVLRWNCDQLKRFGSTAK